jgi:hypothetical protein
MIFLDENEYVRFKQKLVLYLISKIVFIYSRHILADSTPSFVEKLAYEN